MIWERSGGVVTTAVHAPERSKAARKSLTIPQFKWGLLVWGGSCFFFILSRLSTRREKGLVWCVCVYWKKSNMG